MNVLAIKANPELMSERTNPGEGINHGIKCYGDLSSRLVATMILAGLDSGRYQCRRMCLGALLLLVCSL